MITMMMEVILEQLQLVLDITTRRMPCSFLCDAAVGPCATGV
jgi:hypothetical protein